jgi:hypothetical protein
MKTKNKYIVETNISDIIKHLPEKKQMEMSSLHNKSRIKLLDNCKFNRNKYAMIVTDIKFIIQETQELRRI